MSDHRREHLDELAARIQPSERGACVVPPTEAEKASRSEDARECADRKYKAVKNGPLQPRKN